MQPMEHNPAVTGIGGQVIANGVRGLVTGTATSAEVTALIPAGVDEVSIQAVAAFATEGVQMAALNAYAQEELARAGAAYLEASGIYTAVDGAAAATLT